MTDFTYNIGVPAAPNNPSNDQPLMLENTVSSSEIWQVDHIGFQTANGGTHQQVTYINVAAPGAQIDPTSIAYTAAGLAAPTHPQNYFKNSQGVFPLSAIRAFGVFPSVTSTPPVLTNGFNIASTSYSSGFVLTLNTNAVNGDNVAVFITVTPSNTSTPSWTFSNPNLTISVAVGVTVSFMVIQI